ncbi:hypothetical protein HPB51_022251 [Rhipicephalus microplus]|uniref:Tick transposon n=1 Tax=Rhipicephalus microplus TaxID=6941 RepID=A0A9J6DQH5_RHIMP|nr:hypothetical protein HPB51_022251 [Rhipicephalus microplus]
MPDKDLSPTEMAPRVIIEDQQFIASLFVEGFPQREIACRTGRSKTVITKTVRSSGEGGTFTDAKWFGQPRDTMHEADILIVAAAVVNLFLSAKDIWDELSLNVSTRTVSRLWKEAGSENFTTAQKPFLSERKRQQRLDFPVNHQHWKEEEWKNVLFSN